MEPSEVVIKKALKIVGHGHFKSGFPHFYDSVYHALAIEHKCDFVTSDEKHYEKSKGFGNIKLLREVRVYGD